MTQVGLSPLALVLASRTSELDQRLVDVFAAGSASAATDIVLLDQAPIGSGPAVLGLGAVRALLRRIYELVAAARFATAADLALPQDTGEPGLDSDELGARAEVLAQTFGDVRDELASASTPAELRAALWKAAALSVEGAVPGGDDDDTMSAQAARVAATMEAALALLPAEPASSASPRERVNVYRSRIKALVGADFPVLPVFSLPDAAGLAASTSARAAMLDGDPLAPSAWLQRMGLVRAGVDRLARVVCASELAGGDVTPDDLLVAQLPHVAGDRWLGLPYADGGGPPSAELAIVGVTSGPVDLTAPLAGLFVDAWMETIPDREATTGIAFHHDAPGARPPQVVLLAVPPAAQSTPWSVDALLDTVVEAHDLARLRAVGPRELNWLGTLLPALYLPESLSKDVPTVDLRALVDRYPPAPGATVMGKD